MTLWPWKARMPSQHVQALWSLRYSTEASIQEARQAKRSALSTVSRISEQEPEIRRRRRTLAAVLKEETRDNPRTR